jgi:hypothetical protein
MDIAGALSAIVAAAFVGTAIARAVGVENTDGIDWSEVVIQVAAPAVSPPEPGTAPRCGVGAITSAT